MKKNYLLRSNLFLFHSFFLLYGLVSVMSSCPADKFLTSLLSFVTSTCILYYQSVTRFFFAYFYYVNAKNILSIIVLKRHTGHRHTNHYFHTQPESKNQETTHQNSLKVNHFLK